ncbi:hypothetical protein V6N13_111538 [Hibiscus sabdariffa]
MVVVTVASFELLNSMFVIIDLIFVYSLRPVLAIGRPILSSVHWVSRTPIVLKRKGFQAFIHCSISLPGSANSFVATFVYASPSRRYRYDLWKHLKSLSATVTRPWIVLGDFNATLSLVDRQGCSINSPDKSFQDMVLHCGLHDLGYSGPHFTWSRGSRSARLDRSFGNSLWFERYPHFFLHHLLRMKSDHRPIFLTSNDHSVPRCDRDFKYFSGWSLHPDFKRLVRESWDSIAPITDSIKLFSEAATKWNVEAKIRTRRKAVMSLMVDNGDWCTDHSILRDAATSFFRGLFDTDTDSPPSFPISGLNLYSATLTSEKGVGRQMMKKKILVWE